MVKRLLLLIGFSVCLLALVSCQKDDLDVWDVEPSERFPEFLVGRWKAEMYNWEMEFDADGRVSSLVHYMWGVSIDMADGAYYLDGPDEDTYAMMLMGPCEVRYDSSTRRLRARIIMDRYEIKTPGGMLEGWLRDFFDGPVSEDGKVWSTSWRHMEWLEGANESVDPNFGTLELTFTRVDDEQ